MAGLGSRVGPHLGQLARRALGGEKVAIGAELSKGALTEELRAFYCANRSRRAGTIDGRKERIAAAAPASEDPDLTSPTAAFATVELRRRHPARASHVDRGGNGDFPSLHDPATNDHDCSIILSGVGRQAEFSSLGWPD